MTQRSKYRERDYAFANRCVTVRTSIGITQAELAKTVGVSEQAVQKWEGGLSTPTASHLKDLIALAIRHRAFTLGQELEEARTLWKAARLKVLFDEHWIRLLLTEQAISSPSFVAHAQHPAPGREEAAQYSQQFPRIDWGEAFDVTSFYGRKAELVQLKDWVLKDRCRLIALLGMGGIGKSTLAITLMHQVAEQFEVVVFRSLRDAPTCEDLLADLLQVMSPAFLAELPTSLERRITLLLEQLRTRRSLIVLDNLETLLREGSHNNDYHAGYEAYGRLLQRIGESVHQSCFILTSREKPIEMIPMEGNRALVRSQYLVGLDDEAASQLLQEKDLIGDSRARSKLIRACSGNPLALKLIAETVRELFGNEIAQFLAEKELLTRGVRSLLLQHYERLTPLQRTVFTWFAIAREPLSLDELHALLAKPVPRTYLRESVHDLRRRSLLEYGHSQSTFTLQSVVLEYATDMLIERIVEEIQRGELASLCQYALSNALAKEYVRINQERLLVIPCLDRLLTLYQQPSLLDAHLKQVLEALRQLPMDQQGYGPANILALLRQLRGHLRHLDLSRLALRSAYLQGVEMQHTSLNGATLREMLFTEAIHLVTSVAISGAGTMWAAGSDSGEVRLYHEDGQLLHLIRSAHTDRVNALAFSPNGQYLSSASGDATIKFWHVGSGALRLTLHGHRASVTSFAFAPDGRHLISGSDDGTMRLWDTSTGTCLLTFEDLHGGVVRVTWSPDGSLVASGGADQMIRLWETQTWTSVQMLSGHTHWIQGLAFSPGSTRLASASRDQTVRVWDVVDGSMKAVLRGHTDFVRIAAWSPDERMIASCSNDGTIRLWDTQDSRQRGLFLDHTNVVCSVAFTPDGKQLLSGGEDRTLRLWEVEGGVCVRVVQGYSLSLLAVAWSPDGIHLASGDSEKALILWNVAEGAARQHFFGHQGAVRTVAWSPDGTRIASGSYDHTIRIWDIITGACLHILQGHENLVMSIAWSFDGQWLVSGSWDQTVRVWNVNNGSCLWIGHDSEPVRTVAWKHDGTLVASGNNSGIMHVWQGANGTQQHSVHTHGRAIYGLAWHPAGTLLASGGEDGVLRLWDTSRGTQSIVFADNRTPITTLAWNRQGDILISGSKDGILRWWDSQNNRQLHAQQGHRAWIYASCVSNDGIFLASCGSDGLIQLWNMSRGTHHAALHSERPYEALDVTNTLGLSDAQKADLKLLGAFEN